MAARRGGLVANIALARKLAAPVLARHGQGHGLRRARLQQYEAKVLETKQRSLRRLARQLGQQLVADDDPRQRKAVCKQRHPMTSDLVI
jgi:hypothetical protein